jgi:hypothetical protein
MFLFEWCNVLMHIYIYIYIYTNIYMYVCLFVPVCIRCVSRIDCDPFLSFEGPKIKH